MLPRITASSEVRADSGPARFEEAFADINPPLKPEEARVEANRCLYCYDAPCIRACPTHIDVPRFIKQIGSGNLLGSARTILEANPMGHSCARVCPVEVLCEGACVYHNWQDKPIRIARLQRFATDHAHEAKRGIGRPVSPMLFQAAPPNGRKIAVIGAGPGGLSCAFYLARMGYAPVVFEKKPKAGGLNTYGIAEYKMTQETAEQEVRMVVELGVEIRTGVEVGRDLPLEELEREYEAVYLGMGLGETKSLRVPGEDLPGVWDALTFIEHLKDRDLGPLGKSKTTLVIGAGNTAIDAVTQAKRLGAEKVVMAYRRGPSEMGAYRYEYELAKSDAVEFLWNAAPVKILGSKHVEGVEFARTHTRGEELVVDEKDRFTVACDRVIKAIGQTKHYSLAKGAGIKLDDSGRLVVNSHTGQTSNPRYFAGGDAVNGGKEVVNAAADGKRAAFHIHQMLSGGAAAPPGNEYWVSTIDGRAVAPIPARGAAHAPHV